MTEKGPKWYINSSTGLAILKNGSIVEWATFIKASTKDAIAAELDPPCYPCERCTPHAGLKRKRDGLYSSPPREWGGEVL